MSGGSEHELTAGAGALRYWAAYCEAIKPEMVRLMLARADEERKAIELFKNVDVAAEGDVLVFETGFKPAQEYRRSPFYRSPW